MNLEHGKDFLTGATVVTLTIFPKEYTEADFLPLDRMILNDCFQSDDATIADNLLGLELIARRIEEAQAKVEAA